MGYTSQCERAQRRKCQVSSYFQVSSVNGNLRFEESVKQVSRIQGGPDVQWFGSSEGGRLGLECVVACKFVLLLGC